MVSRQWCKFGISLRCTDHFAYRKTSANICLAFASAFRLTLMFVLSGETPSKCSDESTFVVVAVSDAVEWNKRTQHPLGVVRGSSK